MSKDTNSFGHDKALACESRGFVYKKRGCIVLTHPHFSARTQTDYRPFAVARVVVGRDPQGVNFSLER